MLLLVCNEAVKSKLVKLETSHTVIDSPMVKVLWFPCKEKTKKIDLLVESHLLQMLYVRND